MEDNSKSQRFVRASDRIDLKKFERESNRLFLLGLAMGMVFLSIVVSFVTFEKVRIIRARQIPIKLIIRPQSPTKPYRTSREDVIKSIRRKATGMRKPSTGIETKTTPVPDHGEFEITVDYDPDTISSSDMLPDSLLIEEYASRRMMETVPLKNQVLFDTGTYKSEIIISPHNKKAIQGYTHLLYVWGERFDPPTALHHPVIDLADALNLYTNIEAKPAVEKESDKHIPYYPVIYISTDNLLKLDNPSKFLRSGGFYIIDNGASGKYLTEQQRKQIIFILNDIYGSIYTIRPLERRHPIYHCFFDFEDGPPGGSVPDASRTIEGIYIERQLVGIYCPQGYGSMWKDVSNDAQIKLGVNLAVHGLAPGKWYNNDIRLSFYDTAKKEYTGWHENGRVKFKSSQFGQSGVPSKHLEIGYGQLELSSVWLPQAGISNSRIVSYSINWNSPGKTKFNPNLLKTSYLFNYNGNFENLVKEMTLQKVVHEVNPFDGLKVIPWGTYNIYEGWYGNGQKMYYYNYNDSTFAEWDGEGNIIASEGGFTEMNNENRGNLANRKH